jgi:hypothetical protein
VRPLSKLDELGCALSIERDVEPTGTSLCHPFACPPHTVMHVSCRSSRLKTARSALRIPTPHLAHGR